MYIEKLDIYGYGKWYDQAFHFEKGLNVVIGENEAGKTTLVSFIHSILFGFPTKQSSDIRYEPREGSRYGGKVWLQDKRYGSVGIERVAGKATGDVTIYVNHEEFVSDSFLQSLLFHIQKEWYQSVFSFNLDGLTNLKQMNREKLDRYFMSAGTLGSEEFLKEADRLEGEAAKLYKPMGRVPILNRRLKENEKLTSRLAEAKNQNAQYTHLLNERHTLVHALQEKDMQKESLFESMRILNEMKRNWTHLNELQVLKKEVQKIPTFLLPDDALYKFDQLTEETEHIRENIYQTKDKMQQTQVIHQISDMFKQYQDHQDAFEHLEKKSDETLRHIHDLTFINEKIEATKQKVVSERIKWQLSPMDAIPPKLSKKEIEDFKRTTELEQTIDEKWSKEKEERVFLLYKQRSIGEDIDLLEKKLWVEGKKEEKVSVPSSNKPVNSIAQSSQKNKTIVLIAFMMSVLISGLAFLYTTGWIRWISIAVTAFIGISLVWYVSQNKTSEQGESSHDTGKYEALIQQKQWRQDWQEKLAELDKVEQQLHLNQMKSDQYCEEKKENNQSMNEWKERNQLPKNFTFEHVSVTEDPFMELRLNDSIMKEWETKKETKEHILKQWSEDLCSLSDVFTNEETYATLHLRFRKFMETIRLEEKQKQKYVYMTEQLNKELHQLGIAEESVMKKKQHLFRAAGVSNEKEFRERFLEQKQFFEKKKRFELLQQQFEEESHIIDKYSSLEELEKELSERHLQMKQLNVHIKELRDARIHLEASIQKLEENGEYSVLLQQSENMKAEIQKLLNEWASYKIAASLIEKTLKFAKNDRLPSTIADTQKFFSLLTQGEYTDVTIHQDNISVRHRNGLTFYPAELSRGTAEQLYTALRFSFVQNISGKIPLPVIIDDGFVNFDIPRKKETWKAMEKLSEKVQILYFSSIPPEWEMDADINVLTL